MKPTQIMIKTERESVKYLNHNFGRSIFLKNFRNKSWGMIKSI